MLEFLFSIIASYLSGGLIGIYFWYLIAFAFVATVPVIIRSFFRWR